MFELFVSTKTLGCGNMKEIDLMSIGSYTELPGGNIALPQGYSSVLAPTIRNIPINLQIGSLAEDRLTYRRLLDQVQHPGVAMVGGRP